MDFIITNTTVMALTVGLTEVIKRLGGFTPRTIPAIAVIMGIVLTCLVAGTDATFSEVMLTGIMCGLSSVGLFSGVKNTIQNRK